MWEITSLFIIRNLTYGLRDHTGNKLVLNLLYIANIHLAQYMTGYSNTCIECGEAHNTRVPIENHVCIHLVQSSLVYYARWQPVVTLT